MNQPISCQQRIKAMIASKIDKLNSFQSKKLTQASELINSITLDKTMTYTEGVLIACLGIATGALSDDVFNKETWTPDISKPIHWQVVIYILFTLLTLWVTFTRSQKRELQSNNMRALTEDLNKLVLTQPPLNFLEKFRHLYIKANTMVYKTIEEFIEWENDPSKTSEDRANLISFCVRVILKSLCELSDIYNDQQKGNYTATILIYVPTSELEEQTKANILKKEYLRFSDVHSIDTFNTLEAVLLLIKDLSYKESPNPITDNGNLNEKHQTLYRNNDAHLIALPIPYKKKVKLQDGSYEWYTLPGGPRCIADGEISLLSDTKHIKEWCKTDAHLSRKVQEDLIKYMEERSPQRFQAFLSIPMYHPLDKKRESPIGVINLESTEPGFFSSRSLRSGDKGLDTQRSNEFRAIVTPFVLLTENLLDYYLEDRDTIIKDYLAT